MLGSGFGGVVSANASSAVRVRRKVAPDRARQDWPDYASSAMSFSDRSVLTGLADLAGLQLALAVSVLAIVRVGPQELGPWQDAFGLKSTGGGIVGGLVGGVVVPDCIGSRCLRAGHDLPSRSQFEGSYASCRHHFSFVPVLALPSPLPILRSQPGYLTGYRGIFSVAIAGRDFSDS